LDWLSEL